MKIKRLLKKILPKEFFADYENLIFDRDKPVEKSRTFKGSPHRYHFEFINKQHSVFAVKVGKAMGNLNQFAEEPTEWIILEGEGAVYHLELDGSEHKLGNDDLWLVKVRLYRALEKKLNELQIYCERLD